MSTYRTGNHWGVTIVREGDVDHAWEPFNVGETLCNHAGCRLGKADHTQLVAVVVNGDQALAERICALLNGDDAAVAAIRGRCICNDPPPTVHGKNQPATRPPGWSCPRHGAVI
jgi:hypothetical protein